MSHAGPSISRFSLIFFILSVTGISVKRFINKKMVFFRTIRPGIDRGGGEKVKSEKAEGIGPLILGEKWGWGI